MMGESEGTAQNVLSGTQHLEFNRGLLEGTGEAPFVSWVGTLEIEGNDCYIAYFPTAEPRQVESGMLYAENYAVYDSLMHEFTDGVLTMFEPGPVILEGSDEANANAALQFVAQGTVTAMYPDSDSRGVMSDVRVGHQSLWRGSMDSPDQTTFEGSFSISLGAD